MKLRVTLILFIALIQITPDRVRAQDSGSALQRLQDLRGQLSDVEYRQADLNIRLQQLDNDLLAPIIYGRGLNLHPVVVLLSVVAGGALFGITGSVLAVPLVAVTVAAWRELRTTNIGLEAGDATAGSDV